MGGRKLASLAVAGLVLVAAFSADRSTAMTPWHDVVCDPGDRRTIEARTVGELERALAVAGPGDIVIVAEGTYRGTFELTTSGSAAEPIELCAAGRAVLDGGTTETGYVLHITGDHWIVRGLVLRNANKGIVLDDASFNVVDRVEITELGQEGVHFRTHSTDNVVRGSWIHDTGRLVARFGEGVYIGSATSNWCRYTECGPDRSHRNVVEDNQIGPRVTAESVDVKEGTEGSVIRANRFVGSGMTAAESWVDIKGNGTLVEHNRGSDSARNGFAVNVKLPGWGQGTRFVANVADVNGPGVGFQIDPSAHGTVIGCDNIVTDAAGGFGNLPCQPPDD